MRRDHAVDRLGSPRTRPVRLHARRVLEQWRGELPQPFDVGGGGEQRVVTQQRVEDQSLVGLEDVGAAARLVQRELQALLVEGQAGAGSTALC